MIVYVSMHWLTQVKKIVNDKNVIIESTQLITFLIL